MSRIDDLIASIGTPDSTSLYRYRIPAVPRGSVS
jgi:hypothetical protein